jgi:hypothetical protein
VISRRARREAAARAAATDERVDPRIETIERVLAGLQSVGNVFVFALSAAGWLWLAAQHRGLAPTTGGRTGSETGSVADSVPRTGLVDHLLQPLAGTSGATLVVIMLATCLLLAPVVNPFYTPPDRRLLHTATTASFGILAVATVASSPRRT